MAVLFAASTLGATMFLPWWWRGRKGLYGDHDPAGFYPAEDHFRMRTVQTHGGLADLNLIFNSPRVMERLFDAIVDSQRGHFLVLAPSLTSQGGR